MKTEELIRNIIRTEIKAALTEELRPVLKFLLEAKKDNSTVISANNKVATQVVNKLGLTKIPKSANVNPMSELLSETYKTMIKEPVQNFQVQGHNQEPIKTLNFNTSDLKYVTPTVETPSTWTPDSALESIEITDVPDFSGIMGKLKEKGKI